MNSLRSDRPAALLLSVLLFSVPLLHAPGLASPFEYPKEAAIVIGAILLWIGAAAGRLMGASTAATPRVPRLAAAGMLLAGAVAATLSANHALSLRRLGLDLALVGAGWGAARFARQPRLARWIFSAVLLSAALVAAGTLAQVAVPGYSVTLAGVSLLPPAPSGATLGDPGLAAQFLLLALPFGLGAAALARTAGRLLCGAALGLVATAIVAVGQPEGWLAGGWLVGAMLATGYVRTWIHRGWRGLIPDIAGSAFRACLAAAIAILLVVAAARLPGLSATGHPPMPLTHVGLLAPTTGEPATDRAAASRGTARLLALHPFGVGPGYWRHAFLEVAWTGALPSPFTLSHQAMHLGNGYLELAAEYGVAGGILFGALLLLLIVRAARPAIREPGPEGMVAWTALHVLLAGAIVAFLGAPFQEATPALLFWIAAGLALGAPQAPAPEPDAAARGEAIGRAARAASWALLAAGIAASIVAAAWLRARYVDEALTFAGQGLLYSGDPKGAIQLLSRPEPGASPEHLPHALLGNALVKAGRYQEATAAFAETLKRSPWFIAAHLGRSAAWEALGRYDRSEEDLRAALAIWPDNIETWMNLGRLDSRRGRLDQALADYRGAADRDPALADPWFAMGEIYVRRGQYDEAIAAFQTCAEKNPRHPRANLSLGEAFEKKGLYEMSVRLYQRAAGLDEKAVEPRLRLANALHALGKECEALDSLVAARDLDVDPGRRTIILGLIDKVDPLCRKETGKRQGR